MTTNLTREARYRRIAEHWPELREDCPGDVLVLPGDYQERWRLLTHNNSDALSNVEPCDCGGSGWTAKADPWSLNVRAKKAGVNVHVWLDDTLAIAEERLLAAVERLLGLEE